MEVYIQKKDWDKIINYARCASDKWSTEIGGMAVTRQDKDGNWEIVDPQIMKQEVSAALCELDKTELATYYSKMAIKYRKDNIRFCWWHSHAKMDAFWSGTDTNTIDEYEDRDLSFALVVNDREEYKCRVSVWKPFTIHKDVELQIIDKEDGYKIPKRINTDVEKYCTKPETTFYNSGSQYANQANLFKKGTHYSPDKSSVELSKVSKAWEELIDIVEEANTAFIICLLYTSPSPRD